jgi:DNA-binding SARP family transcriptional activator
MNAPTMRLRCFGRYALELGRASLDTGALKPRVRSLLWLLSVRAGQALHAELLIESLWPGVDLASGRRSLQVAVSSLRKALEPDVHRGGWERITRDGDSYRLALGPDDDVDISRFETGMATARAHRRAGRDQDALVAFERAVAVYGGDLVPEAGPADWAVAAREACRLELVDASVAIAELRLARGEPTAAIVACQQGIRADRYHDALWRLLMHAYDEVGDHAQAARARTSYDAVLAELGVTP